MKKILIVILLIGLAVGARLLYLSQQDDGAAQSPVPVINAMDILHASDLKAGIKRAVANDNQKAIEQWMDKALHVGEEAGLNEQDLEWLASKQAENYVIFNAKRALFNDAFERRFLALQSIDDLKKQYPEAKNLFPKADNLIKKRDQIIYSIAQTMAGGDSPTEQQLSEARKEWKARYKAQSTGLTPGAD